MFNIRCICSRFDAIFFVLCINVFVYEFNLYDTLSYGRYCLFLGFWLFVVHKMPNLLFIKFWKWLKLSAISYGLWSVCDSDRSVGIDPVFYVSGAQSSVEHCDSLVWKRSWASSATSFHTVYNSVIVYHYRYVCCSISHVTSPDHRLWHLIISKERDYSRVVNDSKITVIGHAHKKDAEAWWSQQ